MPPAPGTAGLQPFGLSAKNLPLFTSSRMNLSDLPLCNGPLIQLSLPLRD